MVCETINANVDSLTEGTFDEDQGTTSTEVDFTDIFEVVIDGDAEPVDWDEALASFLLSYVRKNQKERTKVEGRFPHEFSAI
jgi:hypothetical protein